MKVLILRSIPFLGPVESDKRNRRVIIPSIDRLRKTSIRCVPDDDLNICCAKAILLAVAEVEKDGDLGSLRRKDCCILQRRAIALHQKTGVPQGPCGFEEIALFEQYLKIQVIVISTTALNQKGTTALRFVMYVVVLRAKLGKANDALIAIGTRFLNFVSRCIRRMDFVINCINEGNAAKLSKEKSALKVNINVEKRDAPAARRSDVDILRRCCKIFREQFQSLTGLDPFTYVTIASACMAVCRSGHIKPKMIAMVPV
ncbi:uncharacterized protein TNCT_82171 [Trichonephila clavata]|uniref:Uncharacterized protein n=1 Tax=Trichonephila clavata TaxID=2740835 RepID=A0A8X6HB71_TRICU|nr:uncharacterized protein TNCT_82171 [Trichonephila clavata]